MTKAGFLFLFVLLIAGCEKKNDIDDIPPIPFDPAGEAAGNYLVFNIYEVWGGGNYSRDTSYNITFPVLKIDSITISADNGSIKLRYEVASSDSLRTVFRGFEPIPSHPDYSLIIYNANPDSITAYFSNGGIGGGWSKKISGYRMQ
ncbi:MAG TPA: hypothetical protein VK154_00620 [Chitinophagales bacterium]|nr:hypothetical protein [Chitinophagales bacterium]